MNQATLGRDMLAERARNRGHSVRHLEKPTNRGIARRIARSSVLVLSAATCICRVHAATTPAIELKTAKTAVVGRIVSRDKRVCWILNSRGELNQVVLSEVESFRKTATRFRPLSTMEVRDQLVREYGREYDVAGRGRYLVVAPRGRAKEYAKLFDGVYRSFRAYFSVRGFQIDEPEFPLIALVFPDRKTFNAYCHKDGITAVSGLRGYYLATTNRIALYDPGVTSIGLGTTPTPNRTDRDPSRWRPEIGRGTMFARLQGSLQDTIIHEATHQIAFNAGLHAREGGTPVWVIEGLGCVFESPGIRDAAKSRNRDAMTRINRLRYVRFQSRFVGAKPVALLRSFVGGDQMYQARTLDAYAYGWALTFFLTETRPTEYARYLRKVASRDPLTAYTQDARLSDFRNAFGDDVDRLETEFLRYFKQLK